MGSDGSSTNLVVYRGRGAVAQVLRGGVYAIQRSDEGGNSVSLKSRKFAMQAWITALKVWSIGIAPCIEIPLSLSEELDFSDMVCVVQSCIDISKWHMQGNRRRWLDIQSGSSIKSCSLSSTWLLSCILRVPKVRSTADQHEQYQFDKRPSPP